MKHYKTGEIARHIGVCRRTVCKWFDTGMLRGFRLPGSKDRRVSENDLTTFLSQHGFPPLNSKEVTQ